MKELSCDQAVAHATALDQAAQAMVKLKEANAARQEVFNREREANYLRLKSEMDTLAPAKKIPKRIWGEIARTSSIECLRSMRFAARTAISKSDALLLYTLPSLNILP